MTTNHYDVIVIGSGAGAKISSYAAKQGMKVALVEEGPLGGACLNRGCIPSKLYIHTADIAMAIRDSEKYNIDARIGRVHFPDIVKRVTGYVDGHSQKSESSTKDNDNIDLYQARGAFVDTKTLEVDGQRITGDKILIAAGARPTISPIEGLSDTPYITSTEALRMDHLPKSMIIVGGGYIGAEMGHFFGALGTDVTVLQSNEMLIPNEDSDIARIFTEVFSRAHTIKTGTRAEKVSYDGKQFIVTADGIDYQAEQLLVATGVTPNTDILAVDKTGVEMDDKGFIKVDEYMRTNVDGIWALGDIIGKYLFRHAANWEARYVIQNMFTDQEMPIDYAAMPHAVFSNPQVGSVGATEDELKEQGIEYTVGIAEYKNTAMGEAHLERDGIVKALADKDKHKILGCHIIGPEASTLIHEVIVAMKADMDVSVITNSIHIHPAMNEVVQRAFMKLG